MKIIPILFAFVFAIVGVMGFIYVAAIAQDETTTITSNSTALNGTAATSAHSTATNVGTLVAGSTPILVWGVVLLGVFVFITMLFTMVKVLR